MLHLFTDIPMFHGLLFSIAPDFRMPGQKSETSQAHFERGTFFPSSPQKVRGAPNPKILRRKSPEWCKHAKNLWYPVFQDILL